MAIMSDAAVIYTFLGISIGQMNVVFCWVPTQEWTNRAGKSSLNVVGSFCNFKQNDT